MKTEMKKSIDQYVELYDAIQEKTGNDAIAMAILQELGKDMRLSRFAETGSNGPATEKQKSYLTDLGIEFSDSITKKDASELIDQSKSC